MAWERGQCRVYARSSIVMYINRSIFHKNGFVSHIASWQGITVMMSLTIGCCQFYCFFAVWQTSTSNNNLCVEESESEEKQDHTLTTFKYQFCLCCMYMNCSVTFQCWYMVLTISVDKTKWLCSTFCRQYDLRHLYPSLCYVCTGRLHCNSVKSFWQMTLVFFLGGQSFTQVLK